jgi:hypothetical protein
MSIRKMLRDSAKQISKAEDAKAEVRNQTILLSQFTVGLIATGDHPQEVRLLQKIVASMMEEDSVQKRLVGKMKDMPNEGEADEAVRFHCHLLTQQAQAAAEGDVMDTLGADVLKTERELRIVVESIQAWLSIMVKIDWDTEMDMREALEEAELALSKLDAVQKDAMAIRDDGSKTA